MIVNEWESVAERLRRGRAVCKGAVSDIQVETQRWHDHVVLIANDGGINDKRRAGSLDHLVLRSGYEGSVQKIDSIVDL